MTRIGLQSVRIVVIGGGFCGTAFVLHLLRDHPGLEASVTVVEPQRLLGGGLAYGRAGPEHRTNVAASRMSVFPEDALHFDRWLRERGEPQRDPACLAAGGLFVRRRMFGAYVRAMLAEQIRRSPGVSFNHITERAVSVAADGDGFQVSLRAGGTLDATHVVLAESHARPDVPAALRGHGGLIANPWNRRLVGGISPDSRVLIVGTGLTACDVVASLEARGHRGPITALSRHGLLPRPRTMLPVEAEGDFSTAPALTASALLRSTRRAIALAGSAGRPWENVIAALREQAFAAWGSLDTPERRRLLRHVRAYWDVHRYQCAPQIDATLRTMLAEGRLSVRAASLVGAGPAAVTIRPRGGMVTETLAAETVIVCTGPGRGRLGRQHPELAGLIEAGVLQGDPGGLGILVDERSRVLRADGVANPALFVAGPLARFTHGELMGMPQVNDQPRAVARRIAGCLEV